MVPPAFHELSWEKDHWSWISIPIRHHSEEIQSITFIHRNPYDVYASNKYLWKITDEDYSFQKLHSEQVSEVIIFSYRLLTKNYLDNRNLIPAGRLFEMSYENLIADPLAMFEKIYESFNISGFERARIGLKQKLISLGKYRQSKYSLSEEEKISINENWGELFTQLSMNAS